jgi:hypothetical protein
MGNKKCENISQRAIDLWTRLDTMRAVTMDLKAQSDELERIACDWRVLFSEIVQQQFPEKGHVSEYQSLVSIVEHIVNICSSEFSSQSWSLEAAVGELYVYLTQEGFPLQRSGLKHPTDIESTGGSLKGSCKDLLAG